MRFYTNQHKHYCGVDLHSTTMYLCILDTEGKIVLHRNIKTNPEEFLCAIAPYRDDLVVAVECMHPSRWVCWYWLSDVCQEQGIAFVLGHALYMKAINGGKSKSDKIDSEKIARMVKGGMLPIAYVYPPELRATRDLMRRRLFLFRKRAELISHIWMTHQQYNLPVPDIRTKSALYYALLKTFPGIGDILSLTLLYEIQDIKRFPTVQHFASYARLVKPKKTSAGKVTGSGGSKIGSAHYSCSQNRKSRLSHPHRTRCI